jgi:DNA-binding transcriptional LysR family regulator
MRVLRVAFDVVPLARWGPLFHVLCLEHPDVQLSWRPAGFPVQGRSLLEGADVGLFVAPPREAGLSELTLQTSEMLVTMAVGHHLARGDGLRVADVLGEAFPGAPHLHPEWRAFWTLDARRGGPPRWTDDRVENAEQALDVVVSGRAIGTVSAPMANGLAHPGVVAVPLLDGPLVPTCLVSRSDGEHPIVDSLLSLARDMTREIETPNRAAAGRRPSPPGPGRGAKRHGDGRRATP